MSIFEEIDICEYNKNTFSELAEQYLKKHTLEDVWGENGVLVKLRNGEESIYKYFPPIHLLYNNTTNKVEVLCKPSSGFYKDQILFILEKNNDPIPSFIQFKTDVIFVDQKTNIINYDEGIKRIYSEQTCR